jgi:hypothetical protein
LSSDNEKRSAWVVRPVDDDERMIAGSIDTGEVNGQEPNYALDVHECGSCQCDLTTRGLAVDGALKGQGIWGYFCIPCFLRECEGIGWGKGQLYARQPSGDWRLVAGFPPLE